MFEGEISAVEDAMRREAELSEKNGQKVGIIDFGDDIEEAARSFFKELRRLDNSDIDIIFAAGVPETGMGIAVMDRMRKAAAYNITLI